ncbi:hypothetical protein G7Y79_00072g097900 [Physcia stellaris]|nr:hypothetical protein G7Y79_00072g097900 [Physcia stellaris]
MFSSCLIICFGGFVAIARALEAASQGSLSVSSPGDLPDPWQRIVPSGQIASVLDSPFIPTSPPPLAHNNSALIKVGLNVNESITWTAGLNGNVIGVQCRREYGLELDVNDCLDAWRWTPRDATERTFALRHHPRLKPDIPLPFRTMGSNGKCAIDVGLIPMIETGRASGNEIAQGAQAVIQSCVKAQRMGGMAINIGGDNRVAVSLSKHEAKVRCQGQSVPIQVAACSTIQWAMNAAPKQKLFGDPLMDPDVDVRLPFGFLAKAFNILTLEMLIETGRCRVTIASNHKNPDIETWYHLWEAVTALKDVCARAGKRGVAIGYGIRGRLFVQMSEGHGLSLAGATNGSVATD